MEGSGTAKTHGARNRFRVAEKMFRRTAVIIGKKWVRRSRTLHRGFDGLGPGKKRCATPYPKCVKNAVFPRVLRTLFWLCGEFVSVCVCHRNSSSLGFCRCKRFGTLLHCTESRYYLCGSAPCDLKGYTFT
jgi:hypothetical protein